MIIIIMSNYIINPIVGYFGAEIIGNITSISNFTILSLLNMYAILVFRNQIISQEEYVNFANKLGKPIFAHPIIGGDIKYREILEVDSSKIGKNAKWHTDISFIKNPPSISILRSEDEIPNYAGDTLWSDLRTSYNYLSYDMKEFLNNLEAIHKITPLAYWGEPYDNIKLDENKIKLYEKSKEMIPVIHPVVRLHPRTNKPGLFVNPGFTSHILNVSKIESDYILNLLYEHTTQPEFILRHKWKKNDIVIWDNIRTMHYAINDYDCIRKLYRICIEGNIPYGFNNKTSRDAYNNLYKYEV